MFVKVSPSIPSRELHSIAILGLFVMMKVVLGSMGKSGLYGSERYLVYPTPATGAPTKVQLITGLGIPMELDVSMIVGYVMKFNYALPYNVSDLTYPYSLLDDRSMNRESNFDVQDKKNNSERSEPGNIEGVMPSRWKIYKVIESALKGSQVSGKGCLLRTICHVAEVPFEIDHSGVFAELIHILLMPSTTREKYETIGDQEYDSAESAGRDNPGKCENIFPECDRNLLEYFTETYVFEDSIKHDGIIH